MDETITNTLYEERGLGIKILLQPCNQFDEKERGAGVEGEIRAFRAERHERDYFSEACSWSSTTSTVVAEDRHHLRWHSRGRVFELRGHMSKCASPK